MILHKNTDLSGVALLWWDENHWIRNAEIYVKETEEKRTLQDITLYAYIEIVRKLLEPNINRVLPKDNLS